MTMIAQAVESLRPDAEWTFGGEDVESIIWHTEGAKPLTNAEVQAEIKRLKKVELDQAKAAATATTAAIAHAKSIGFTDAMIAVMYPNLGA